MIACALCAFLWQGALAQQAEVPREWIDQDTGHRVVRLSDGVLPNAKDLVRPGVLKAEKLVNLSKHNYNLEPNVTFTPDMKWIVFRSNLFGPTHVFAVEIAKKTTVSSN